MPVIPLFPRRDFDFSSVAGGLSIVVPLEQALRVATWGRGSLLVRVHAANIPSGATVQVRARVSAPTEEDPATFFRDRALAVAQVDSRSTAPALIVAAASIAPGYVAISVVGSQAAIAATFTVTLSADLAVQDHVDPWTPATLGSKLTLWLDQRDQTIVSGAISNWGDESGTGNSFSQSTAGNRPTTGSLINGWAAPSFVQSGTNESMTGPAAISSLITATAYHVFVVLRARSAAGTNATVYLNNGVIADAGIGWWGLYLKNTSEVHGFHWDSGSRDVVVTGLPLNVDVLLEWSYDGSTLRLRMNAGATSTAAGGGAIGSVANPAALGTGATGSLFFDGLLASAIVCNAYLSSSDVGAVRAYLSSKYGVPA